MVKIQKASTVEKIQKAYADLKKTKRGRPAKSIEEIEAGLEQKAVSNVQVLDERVVSPPVTGNLAIVQPVTTREHDLALRGIPESESNKPGFVEPAFDGLYWKENGQVLNEQGNKKAGWYTQRMWDGSYNVVEER